MAIFALCGGRREAKPHQNAFSRFFFGIAKEFNKMSISGALRSKNAEEFKNSCPSGEDNWKSRMAFATTLADAIERNASDVPAGLPAMLEPFYNNLVDCALSERTTLSNAACRLLGSLPKVLGKDIHPQLDRFLPALIRQCASTKAVAQKSASAAITNIITFAPYNGRLLWHVCQAFEDKYTAPKLYAPAWLKLIIQNYHPALNPDRDFELISRAITNGLVEADNNVRVNTRATFWEYHKIDPVGADNIMNNTLHSAAKTALLNDPNNPDKSHAAGKKKADTGTSLAQIRQQAKQNLKQKTAERNTSERSTAERNRVVSAQTITSADFPFGALDLQDDTNNKSTQKAPVIEAPSSRPFLSAPVRRPRIIATPINATQKTVRPNTVSVPTNVQTNVPATVRVPLMPKPQKDPNAGSVSPPKSIPIPDDGLNKEQRIKHQEWDREMEAMAPLVPLLATQFERQDDEKSTQMHHAYPDLYDNGEVENARRAFKKALEYLSKGALDSMGFRRLRKLLETHGRNLIIDKKLYDNLFSELLPRLGNFDELLTQPIHEIQNQNHPRYIRSAVVAMVNVLVHAYPQSWSAQYQGRALAALMIARCTYSANTTPHDGAPYVNPLTIVSHISNSILIITESCGNPLGVLDSVLEVLYASETFLMNCAPHDSENQTPGSWASFNPYSKVHRLRTETTGLNHPKPMNLSEFSNTDPTPLPRKLPLIMETGLKIIKTLLLKAERDEHPLGEEREDTLADLARHLLPSYSIIIRKEVVSFCRVLYTLVDSERFWSHFQNESERNLLHYYLSKHNAALIE